MQNIVAIITEASIISGITLLELFFKQDLNKTNF